MSSSDPVLRLDDPADDAILAQLRAWVSRTDPVPARVLAAAGRAWDARAPRGDVAALHSDSHDSGETGAGELAAGEAGAGEAGAVSATTSRARREPRRLRFSSDRLTVHVLVLPGGRRRRVEGRIVPAAALPVHVHHADGRHEIVADAEGRFVAHDIPAGPVSVQCWAPEGAVATDWVVV